MSEWQRRKACLREAKKSNNQQLSVVLLLCCVMMVSPRNRSKPLLAWLVHGWVTMTEVYRTVGRHNFNTI